MLWLIEPHIDMIYGQPDPKLPNNSNAQHQFGILTRLGPLHLSLDQFPPVRTCRRPQEVCELVRIVMMVDLSTELYLGQYLVAGLDSMVHWCV